jgi:hypothetical protein
MNGGKIVEAKTARCSRRAAGIRGLPPALTIKSRDRILQWPGAYISI